ncbi:zinc-binding alcohol dehydrogenase family protein [Bacillus sp. JJ1533]|uniref:zinc-binding alcohol dehydrogenase family protein n=1 Tax=Bacillus sp. JJ1533 TaxID=3122959 RepID=UPI002FFF9EBF
MKSIVCEEPNKFVMREVAKPQLKKGEALIKIKRIGICGTDLHAYAGNQPYFNYPRILGHELSGEIADLSDSYEPFEIGDYVSIIPYLECGQCIACKSGRTNCCQHLNVIGVHVDGGMQEYIAVPIKNLVKTNEISLDAAAIIECLSIGAHAVNRANIQQGEFALVIGAGPIGLGIMKFAHLKDARVIAMDTNEERLAFSKTWGSAELTVNATTDIQESLLNITNGSMPTLIFDATGNSKSMENTFNLLAHGGKLVFVSLVEDTISFYDPDFHKKETTLLSSRNATLEDFEFVFQAIRNGEVDTDQFITNRIHFDSLIESFESLLDPKNKVIKAIVEL